MPEPFICNSPVSSSILKDNKFWSQIDGEDRVSKKRRGTTPGNNYGGYLDSDHNVAIKSTRVREETFAGNSSQDEIDIEIDLKHGNHKVRGIMNSGSKGNRGSSSHKKKKRKK